MLSLTLLTIRRAREQRLPQVAGSLTFTTVLSVVPFLAASFALFTRFPVFRRFEQAIEDYLLRSLLPADIARTVLRYIGQFVENALNQIWEVKKGRPFFRRVGLYLLMLAMGPPVLGASLWAASYLLSASLGLIGPVPPSVRFALDLGPMLLCLAGLTAMFYFMPNTRVRPRDALVGGMIASGAIELGKRGFTAYVLKAPTYKAVYGAFAAVPAFLLWVYFSWLVTLAAALITANLSRTGPRKPK